MPERTSRIMIGARYSPRHTAGRMRLRKPERPDTGTSRDQTANTRIRRMPSQNVGMAWPTTETIDAR